jgi:fibronectin type 3 domain-containing protein
MTFALSNGESEHDPGAVTLGMFQDMGWTMVSRGPPTAPSGLNASAVSRTQINLSWTDNSSVEDGYKIWRSPNGATGWRQVGTVGVNGTAFSDTTVVSGSTYYYRVNAYNENGDSAYSNIVRAIVGIKTYLPLILVNWP